MRLGVESIQYCWMVPICSNMVPICSNRVRFYLIFKTGACKLKFRESGNMKSRSLVLAFFSLFMAQAVFAGTVSNCVSRSNVSDGSGGYITGFDCNFYHEAVYPFNLTSFITNGGASLSETRFRQATSSGRPTPLTSPTRR